MLQRNFLGLPGRIGTALLITDSERLHRLLNSLAYYFAFIFTSASVERLPLTGWSNMPNQ